VIPALLPEGHHIGIRFLLWCFSAKHRIFSASSRYLLSSIGKRCFVIQYKRYAGGARVEKRDKLRMLVVSQITTTVATIAARSQMTITAKRNHCIRRKVIGKWILSPLWNENSPRYCLYRWSGGRVKLLDIYPPTEVKAKCFSRAASLPLISKSSRFLRWKLLLLLTLINLAL